MDKHIFDILGIGSREDSYSDLIAEAFKELKEFRVSLLNALSEPYADDWKIQTRVNVPVVIPGGRKRDIPDIVFSSANLNKIIVLENKIFSGEGWEQTIRYAEDIFKEKIAQHATIGLENPEFSFYYLTLDGSKPASNEFIPIRYDTVILSALLSSNYSGVKNNKLCFLLEELKERIEEYKNWREPEPDEEVLEYLNNTKRLVNQERTFFIAAQKIFRFDSNAIYEHDYGVTANRASSFIPLVAFRKKEWIGSKYVVGHVCNGDTCRNIHYEFQWDTRKDCESITLYLHYELNPYKTKKEMDSISDQDFLDKYFLRRKEFFEEIQKRSTGLWRIDQTVLRIGCVVFDKKDTFEQLQLKIDNLLTTMTPIVDELL